MYQVKLYQSFSRALYKLILVLNLILEIIKFMLHNYLKRRIYPFKFNEFSLYIKERYFTSMSNFTIENSYIKGLSKIKIRDTIFYYPSQLAVDDLPWLHHEVFDNFSVNPSSYDHPKLDYKSRNWIIDAGAAEGFFTFFASQKTSARIISIDPVAQLCNSLQKSVQDFNYNTSKHITISAALGEKSGNINFEIDADRICSSRIIADEELSNSDKIKNNVVVPILTLDQIANDLDLGYQGLVKMDIEDYEVHALTGAVSLMRQFKPNLAIAIYHSFENARKCKEIIYNANKSYKIEMRGYYGWESPPRPYMIFAY